MPETINRLIAWAMIGAAFRQGNINQLSEEEIENNYKQLIKKEAKKNFKRIMGELRK
jgi:hypothetical protein